MHEYNTYQYTHACTYVTSHTHTESHTQMSLFVQLRPDHRNALIEFKAWSLLLLDGWNGSSPADLNTQTQLLLCVSSHNNLNLFVQSQLFLGWRKLMTSFFFFLNYNIHQRSQMHSNMPLMYSKHMFLMVVSYVRVFCLSNLTYLTVARVHMWERTQNDFTLCSSCRSSTLHSGFVISCFGFTIMLLAERRWSHLIFCCTIQSASRCEHTFIIKSVLLSLRCSLLLPLTTCVFTHVGQKLTEHLSTFSFLVNLTSVLQILSWGCIITK